MSLLRLLLFFASDGISGSYKLAQTCVTSSNFIMEHCLVCLYWSQYRKTFNISYITNFSHFC